MKLYTLDSKRRVRGAKWELVEASRKLSGIRRVQAALRANWVEPHDFRILVWGR